MPDKEAEKKYRELSTNLNETAVRIRRYSLDEFLREPDEDGDPDPGKNLRRQADDAWKKWLELRTKFDALEPTAPASSILEIEHSWLQLERDVDLIQRELISEESLKTGLKTVTWLAISLITLTLIYLGSHGVWKSNFQEFEPWAEWGPAKYGEVVFWSLFGVLCGLLFLGAKYMARRDFDPCYPPWYLATALRAPFLCVILMILILEFVEWYGEGTWIQDYILEEGNKFYFIAFVSFCLGLGSDSTSGIIRELSESVTEFVRRVVGRFGRKLSTAVADKSTTLR